jgi:hypothetical protein
MRLRWCRLALVALIKRWGGYAVVLAASVGAGSNDPVDAIGALAAWLVLPLFKAALAPLWWLPVVGVYALLGGLLAWALRSVLWPQRWALAERALPVQPAQRLRSDALVVALGLSPLLALYALGALTWARHHPAWLASAWWPAMVGLVVVGLGSVAAGVAVLQALRRPPRWRAVPPAASVLARRGPGHLGIVGALWVLPLWRGPARRTGVGLVLGTATLVGQGLALPMWAPSALGWCLAIWSLSLLVVASQLQALSRLEFSPLMVACAVLPLSPAALSRQRAALALVPAGLGLLALAALLPWAQLRGAVALAYLVTCGGAALAEVLGLGGHSESKAARWLVSLVLMVALASEVLP